MAETHRARDIHITVNPAASETAVPPRREGEITAGEAVLNILTDIVTDYLAENPEKSAPGRAAVRAALIQWAKR